MRRFVTCPESGHLEEIEYYEGPASGRVLGVARCSAFHPPEGVDCAATCIRQINRGLARLSALRQTLSGQLRTKAVKS